MSAPAAPQVLVGRDEWQRAREAHQQRARELLGPVVARRRRGERHPVEDFLFDYYSVRPGQLVAWHPGVHRVLEDAEGEFGSLRFHRATDGRVEVDAAGVLARRGDTVAWVERLLGAVRGRPASFGCFGMHEWAMVYGLDADQTRHAGLPLRPQPDEVRRTVEQVGLRCTHFDAFRFFTPDAAPRNAVALTREGQPEHDQGGCLHANMDLYKWAGKLLPLTPPELLLDAYELARDIRVLDMRASAYDLRGLGYEPVRVETASGRAEYVAQQRVFAARAEPLRARLLDLIGAARVVAARQAGRMSAVT
ncbi:MAG TPA: 3-methyladenine DNA glycosylase [Propionibacteriaceae bacterium]|nr:3-methyladenine DNA glycosylase [Propionibacteriaceae bacterium]